MLDNEVEIARFLLGCNSVVFIAETAFASRIRPYVSHETVYLCLFYYLVATCASRRGLTAITRGVWAGVTWVTLCSIPSATLVSFLYHLRHSIVDCLAHDDDNGHISGSALASCRFGGDRRRCESFWVAATRQTVQEGCATFVLGPFMGAVYAILVFLLRFVPCFFGGIYFAFYFDEDRLYLPGTTSLRVPTDHDQEDSLSSPSLPSSTFYIAWALLLWGAFALEFSAGQHIELSSYTILILFVVLVLVQIYRSQHGRLPDVDRILQRLQFLGSIVLIVFTYMDFLRNAIALASTCAGLVDYKILAECRAGDTVCLDLRNALSTTFFRQHDCPQLSLDPARYVYFYLSQALRLVFLGLIYPAAMVHRHLRPLDSPYHHHHPHHLTGTAFLKQRVNDTPANELRQMLLTAAKLDLEQQQQQHEQREQQQQQS